jgi:hypothetical protein
MPYNQNDFDLQKKNEHNFNLNINQEQKFNLTLQNQYNFSLNIFGFVKSRSIHVKLRHTIRTIIGFLLRSKIHFISKVNLKTIIGFKMLKQYFININQSIKTNISFLIIKKIKSVSSSGFRVGKIGTLGVLDNLLLSDLDGKTLDQLNFIYGVVLKMKKRILGLSKSTITLTSNLNLYQYNKLSSYDNLTLNDLDIQTLGSLDRTIL